MPDTALHTDTALLYQMAAGDQRAFTRLYTIHFGVLFHFTSRLVADRPQSEEIVNRAFEKAWERKVTFRSPDELRAFLYVTCRNAAYDLLRRRTRNREVPDPNVEGHEVADAEETATLFEMVRAELLNKVYQAIQALPAQQRTVMERLYLQNASTEDVARELGISNENVRSHKRYALRQLRKTLAWHQWAWIVCCLLHK